MKRKQQAGFTLLETMVSLFVLLAISAIVMNGMNQMMMTQGTIANRTEMHTSVRGATELLEQEIGQAGRIALPPRPAGAVGPWLMLTPIVVVANAPVTVAGVQFSPELTTLFAGEQLLVDTGFNQETITISNPVGGTWTAGPFYNSHGGIGVTVPISAPGAFSDGVLLPPVSTANTLKLFGDINGDGNMLYIEYTCVQGTAAAPGFLYRNQIAFNAAAKTWGAPPLPASTALLTNLGTNPGGTPCFTYQVQTSGPYTFITDVAVTLTELTQNADPQTHVKQSETKALLNVSPRNVFNAFLLARQNNTNRVQAMPLVTKTNLLFP